MPQVTTLTGEFPFVFLGGTCAGPDWRQDLIPRLTVDYFNPLVENWTPEDARKETLAKYRATANIFVITPHAIGSYSIAEMTELAVQGHRLIAYFHEDESARWNDHQRKSNKAISELLISHGAKVVDSLDAVIEMANRFRSR